MARGVLPATYSTSDPCYSHISGHILYACRDCQAQPRGVTSCTTCNGSGVTSELCPRCGGANFSNTYAGMNQSSHNHGGPSRRRGTTSSSGSS